MDAPVLAVSGLRKSYRGKEALAGVDLEIRAGELVGRLKTNGRLSTYSPLSRLLELEMLLAGIDAKRSLWRSLNTAAIGELSDFDFDEMERRASSQRTRLIPFHAQAALAAFARGGHDDDG